MAFAQDVTIQPVTNSIPQKEPSEGMKWDMKIPDWVWGPGGTRIPLAVISVPPGRVETLREPTPITPIILVKPPPSNELGPLSIPFIEAEQTLEAGMPLWGWVVIVGIGLSLFLGKKK